MNRYICIHGHFYQPPRENPWTEEIELQSSAAPWHDWNQRINEECYRVNTDARILDEQGRITRIVNNYSRISFNFGATLLSWLERYDPTTYEAILDADRISAQRYGGHGSALAQVYNHLLMPLANPRDKETQVIWGLRDFEHRFQRPAEGMWLAETAVDTETLEALAAQDVKFTILAPHQAQAVREIITTSTGAQEWQEVDQERLDSARPYLCRLPSGRQITLFFYHGRQARAVAFEHILNDGQNFAESLKTAFAVNATVDQLVQIATDGESYGHHHQHGEMALAFALDYIEEFELAQLTNYGQYLAVHPPEWEVRLAEPTAWSCAHGVGRWSRDCGCNSGFHPTWNQTWRTPLRQGFDFLRDSLAQIYEALAGKYFANPWQVRNAYLNVILNRSENRVLKFLKEHSLVEVTAESAVTMLQLLELQRQTQLMYTSCGWFFDDVTGLETVQVIQYAARALDLAQSLAGHSRAAEIEQTFLNPLEQAQSNEDPEVNGRSLFEAIKGSKKLDLPKTTFHLICCYCFSPDRSTKSYSKFSHRLELENFTESIHETKSLWFGTCLLKSQLTLESERSGFILLQQPDKSLLVRICANPEEQLFRKTTNRLLKMFETGEVQNIETHLQHCLQGATYQFTDLLPDVQRGYLDYLERQFKLQVESEWDGFRELLSQHLSSLDKTTPLKLPSAKQTIFDLAWQVEVDRCLSASPLKLVQLTELLDQGRKLDLSPELMKLETALERFLASSLDQFQQTSSRPRIEASIRTTLQIIDLAREYAIPLNLRSSQNLVWNFAKSEGFKEFSAILKTAESIENLWRKLVDNLNLNLE